MGFPLPPELISMVLEFIIAQEIADMTPDGAPYPTQKPNLVPYATINRAWQAAIERETFSSIKIDSNKRLAEFKQFPWDQSWSQRRSYIRTIHFIVELESYDFEARRKFENEEEIQRNSKIFTTSIQSLFNVLSEWPEPPDTEMGISLSIKAYSPRNLSAQEREVRQLRRLSPWAETLLTHDVWDMRHQRSYLQFNEEAVNVQCRAVPVIIDLEILAAKGLRKVEPASSCFIAAKLPRLHDLCLILDDNCKWDPQLRERRRNEFADSIQFLPLSIRQLTLGFTHSTPQDETYPPAVLTAEGTPDPLSTRLREFSQQLAGMSLSDCVLGKELFWPLNDDNPEPPFWPHLRSVELDSVPVTPCGKWMFEQFNGLWESDSDSSHISHLDVDAEARRQADEYHFDTYHDMSGPWDLVPEEDRDRRLFRTEFVDELFNQYYISAGKAALHMPKLESMELGFSHRQRVNYQHLFQYTRQNLDGKEMATATWGNEEGFEKFGPSEEVEDTWCEVALEHTGEYPMTDVTDIFSLEQTGRLLRFYE
ncbi:uncharacterized protein N7515_010276 [Penicillium bovifimosum]|uniref:DUF6546 domain-containing protein n=1 Tax=Penicillium bovifimosum TaxID=126998 RepID=A0A9W9GI26_9EURO|nr:uncharacterized protein N7515_010276 [Penicillium bovifimosum]KAJ5120888.1 hypothetical protein N7515_010276 [Penicillium bovifimosum]